MKRLLAKAFGVGLTAMLAGTALAHHSLAMFDTTKIVVKAGTLREVQWTNPHSYFMLTEAGTEAAPKEWAIEGPSPNGLIRRGWKHNEINAGDRVSITFHPRKDGSAGGILMSIRLPDGRELMLIPNTPPPGGLPLD
jgi:hypothetical protein